MFLAPCNSIRKSFTDAAGPKDELVAILFPFLKVIDKRLIGFATIGPFAKTYGAVKVDSYDLIFTFHDGLLPAHRASRSNPGREPGEQL